LVDFSAQEEEQKTEYRPRLYHRRRR
jgi:hypothetical protein